MDFSWVMEPDAAYHIVHNKHDNGYKYLLQVKRIFIQLLRSFVEQGWLQKIDEEAVERIEKSFVLQDFREKEADIIYKVKLDGREVFFYILLELQSTVDYQMPYRLLQYMLEIWRTVLKDTGKNLMQRKDFRLPVIVPCVLYNGKDNWTVCRSFRETQEGNELFEDYILDFKYILFDVKRYDEDKLLELANVIGAAFLMDQKSDPVEIVGRLKKLAGQLEKMNKEDFTIFRTWMKNILLRGMPKEKAEVIEEIIDGSKEADYMVYAIEEALQKKYDAGVQEGIREGMREGMKEGKINDILELLQDMGGLPEEVVRIVRAQEDTAVLSKWLKIAAKVDRIEEFISKIKEVNYTTDAL